MKRDKDRKPDGAEKQIASLFALYELYTLFTDDFRMRLESMCINYNCTLHDFLVIMHRHKDDYEDFRKKVFDADYEFIRKNKKFNFWQHTGNIKISSIHSFKGWESDTIFLILQQKKDGDPSFDELLYTGITRTISNLIVINLGNKEYDQNMRKLIDAYK